MMYRNPTRARWRGKLALSVCCTVLFVAISAIGLGSIFAGNSGLVDSPMTDFEVKAAYIYYFAKFVAWPSEVFPTSSSPINIGIIGDDEFGSLLRKIVKGKMVQDRPVEVLLLKWPADLSSCHIVYVSLSEQKQFRNVKESLQNRPILTVTEAEEPLKNKGIMNLFVEGGKVQFDADIASAEKAHLQISSKLLRMAYGYAGKNLGKQE